MEILIGGRVRSIADSRSKKPFEGRVVGTASVIQPPSSIMRLLAVVELDLEYQGYIDSSECSNYISTIVADFDSIEAI
jgi:hypothetical protein